MNTRIFNFYSGPALLPDEVREQLIDWTRDFAGTGIGLAEISHRSKPFVALMEEARELARELMGLPENYAILFLQGGASMQFAQIPMNFLPSDGLASYADTGQWARRAGTEAENFGEVHWAGSTRDQGYTSVPDLAIHPRSAYLHITTNNTIYGTRYAEMPSPSCPLIADMSSDILSEERDYTRFDLLYASAQKNIGPAGVTLVAMRRDGLQKADRRIPAILDYDIHLQAGSMYHTPSVWAVAGCMLTLRWIQKTGLSVLAEANRRKADMLYAVLDRSEVFYCPVNLRDRSRMNVRFHARRPEWEAAFLELAEKEGLKGLKGYRTIGGFRASLYNAMPEAGVKKLADLLQDFESRA